MLKRKILSALLTLALVAAPMAVGTYSASADSTNISQTLTVISGHRYYVKVNNQYLRAESADSIKMVNNQAQATAFQMNYTANKGYQFIYDTMALTATSRTQNAEIKLVSNTRADNQYWNAYAYTSHYLLTTPDDTAWQIGINGDDVVLKSGLTDLNWEFVEASPSDALQMGVYTIYNRKYDCYLSQDGVPEGKAILTKTAGNNSRWSVFPQGDGTYMIRLSGGGTWANLNFKYPDPSWVAMGTDPVYNRIVHVGGNVYRVVSSLSSFGVLGCSTHPLTGELYPSGCGYNDTSSNYSGDWEFTYVGSVTG